MSKVLKVACLVFDGVNATDVAAPLEAFAAARDERGRPLYTPAIWSVRQRTVRAESGLQLSADRMLPTRAGADLLIVPGGAGIREPQNLAGLSAWLLAHHRRFPRIASICTGAYALAEAGIVNGNSIATHWRHASALQKRYPRVRVDADALFLKDGRFYSSGGVTAGIDLALELIENDFGPRTAMDVARELVVFLRRTGTQNQFSAPLQVQTAASGRLRDVCAWAAANLDDDLSVESLAKRAGLSARQFSRCFLEAFGAPPATYFKAMRLDASRTLLEQGASIASVATASGFLSADVFRRAFERQYGVAPSDYRRGFMIKRGVR
ncbi:MAG TPA: helix-turn-helix domain-containing protein [Opitutus sp.]|nr:helix-turn-helix domain-containing protein [Opitutus sp.]